MKRSFLALVGLALVLAAPASARELPSLTPEAGVTSLSDDVTLIATNGSRTLVGGEFTKGGQYAGRGAIVSAISGTLLHGIDETLVTAVIADGADGWFVGVYPSRVVHVRADGRVDPAFVAPQGSGDVLAFARDGGRLWVGSYDGVMALDAADGHRLPWSAPALHVRDLALSGSTLYVAGGNRAGAVVALDTSTGAVRAAGPAGLTGNGVTVGAGGVYAAVEPSTAVALDPVTLAERWRTNTGWFGHDIAVSGDRVLVTSDNPGVLALDAGSGARLPFSSPATSAGPLVLAPDGRAGYLGTSAADPYAGALAFDTGDGAMLGWLPSAPRVTALAVSPDGDRVFLDSDAGAAMRTRLRAALLDETGTATPWVEGESGQPRAVALDAAGTGYVARPASVSATAADGTPRWRVPVSSGALALALSPDQRTLYLTGTFTSVGGVARPGLAALSTADGSAVAWPVSVAGGSVAGALFSADAMYLYGSFTAVNGAPREGVTAIDPASGAVLPFAPDLNGRTELAKLSPDGTMLWVAGRYNQTDEHTDYVFGVRVSDGAIVVRPDAGSLDALAPLADGQSVVVAGGAYLYAFDAATGAKLDWQVLGCGDCSISALELSPDGRTLHVGGYLGLAGRSYRYFRLPIGAAQAPANTGPARVIGTPAPGAIVECDPGTWTGKPGAFAIAWTLDGARLEGFDNRQLLVEPADAGHALRCEASAGGVATTSPPVTVVSSDAAPRLVRRLPGASQTPLPFATPTPTPSPGPGAGPVASAPARDAAVRAAPDRAAPQLALVRRGGSLRVTLSEPTTVTSTLRAGKRTVTRRFRLAIGTHTLTAKRLSGRAELPRGRYTLTLVARDAAGNSARRVLRFTISRA